MWILQLGVQQWIFGSKLDAIDDAHQRFKIVRMTENVAQQRIILILQDGDEAEIFAIR